ncbi:hypothetical protein EVAR_78880_1 [Eumeta japonica]|uniref:Uncharacterized protein n=1 Tax=Eumeta variegata TaxID=151549 RepID=A0A4C1U2A5_EUMVA|nr:hypothetical protein EVAR_78880_1 [Eumeta japonica]
MQAARHRGHHGRAECTGTAAPGVYWTLKCPTPRGYHAADGGAPARTSWEQLFLVNRCFGALRRSEDDPDEGRSEKRDTGSLTRAWLAVPPPSSTTTPQPGAPTRRERMRNDARPRWPGVSAGLKIEGRERRLKNEGIKGRGSLTRIALAAAVGCVDSLISGRQARSRPTTGGRLRVQLELRLPPTLVEHQLSSRMPPPPAGCACAMIARAPAGGAATAPA